MIEYSFLPLSEQKQQPRRQINKKKKRVKKLNAAHVSNNGIIIVCLIRMERIPKHKKQTDKVVYILCEASIFVLGLLVSCIRGRWTCLKLVKNQLKILLV